MRVNTRSRSLAAFVFLSIVVVSHAVVYWVPVWKQTRVLRYHPTKGWVPVKQSGTGSNFGIQPKKLPSLSKVIKNVHRHYEEEVSHHPVSHADIEQSHNLGVGVHKKYRGWRPSKPRPKPRLPCLLCQAASAWKNRKPINAAPKPKLPPPPPPPKAHKPKPKPKPKPLLNAILKPVLKPAPKPIIQLPIHKPVHHHHPKPKPIHVHSHRPKNLKQKIKRLKAKAHHHKPAHLKLHPQHPLPPPPPPPISFIAKPNPKPKPKPKPLLPLPLPSSVKSVPRGIHRANPFYKIISSYLPTGKYFRPQPLFPIANLNKGKRPKLRKRRPKGKRFPNPHSPKLHLWADFHYPKLQHHTPSKPFNNFNVHLGGLSGSDESFNFNSFQEVHHPPSVPKVNTFFSAGNDHDFLKINDSPGDSREHDKDSLEIPDKGSFENANFNSFFREISHPLENSPSNEVQSSSEFNSPNPDAIPIPQPKPIPKKPYSSPRKPYSSPRKPYSSPRVPKIKNPHTFNRPPKKSSKKPKHSPKPPVTKSPFIPDFSDFTNGNFDLSRPPIDTNAPILSIQQFPAPSSDESYESPFNTVSPLILNELPSSISNSPANKVEFGSAVSSSDETENQVTFFNNFNNFQSFAKERHLQNSGLQQHQHHQPPRQHHPRPKKYPSYYRSGRSRGREFGTSSGFAKGKRGYGWKEWVW